MSDVSCTDVRGLLNALVDDELDVAVATRVEAHLAGCAECRMAYNALSKVVDALRDDPALYFDLPDGIEDRLFPSSAPVIPLGSPGRLARIGRIASPIVSLAALAASLMLYLSVPNTTQMALEDEAVSAHIRSLMGAHMLDVVSSDHHTVKPWFAGKLDFSPPVNDFASAGFPLLGGRIDYIEHTNTAVLAYGGGNHIVTVFIHPGPSPTITTASERGYNVMTWGQGGLSYIAVSDMNTAELERLRGLLKGQGNAP